MVTGTENMTQQLFESIDNKDVQAFLDFLADDVKFRFGNAAPITGKPAVGEAVSGFFSSVKAIHHELIKTWSEEGTVICHGNVTYTRHDSTTLSVPFANILVMENSLIRDYMIFADISDLYENT